MNETMSRGDSIKHLNLSLEDMILKIADNMLLTRPETEAEYRPYIKQPAHQRYMLGPIAVDLSQYYPDSCANACAYAVTDLYCMTGYDVLINIKGNVRLWLEGRELELPERDHKGIGHIPARLHAGYNRLKVKCVNDCGCFGFELIVSVPRYPFLWANDYIFYTRATLPIEGLEGEEGIAVSPLFTGYGSAKAALEADTPFDDREEFAFPQPRYYGEVFDFNRFYDGKYGKSAAYALTFYKEKGIFKIEHPSPVKVYVNGEEVYRSHCGVWTGEVQDNGVVLVKSVKDSGGWGFRCDSHNCAHIPFLTSNRSERLTWLTVGAFHSKGPALDVPMPPEYGLDFDAPYPDGEGGETYWRFNAEDTYLRIYLPSCFFGQWFYAIMVGLHGLNAAGQCLGVERYCRYFNKSVEAAARFFRYASYDKALFGNSQVIARAPVLDDLDRTGTVGMNLIDSYQMTGNARLLYVIDQIEDAVLHRVPRFGDGTFNRVDTMWADDLYMSMSFIVRLAQLKGQTYFDEAKTQLDGFKKRLWIEEKQLFSHIYFPEKGVANRVPWGRGNGWVLLALSELLEFLPQGHALRDTAMAVFTELAHGVAKTQDACGMWHQVLDKSESYLETSCTAMFVLAFAKGVVNGWLDRSYAQKAEKGLEAILATAVDRQGNVYGVCMGSGCAMEAEYYFDIPTKANDDHGTGVVLAAACAVYEMRKRLKG